MRLWRILHLAGRNWSADNASYLAAALAYYALFSVAPLAVLAVDLSAMAYGEAAAQNRLAGYLEQFIGQNAARGVQDLVLKAREPSLNWWTSLLALGVLLFTAANLFVQLKTGLNFMWKLPPLPADRFLRSTVKTYLLALVMVVVVGMFGLILIIASTLLGVFIELWGEWLPGGPALWRTADLGLLLLLITLLMMLTFRLLSDGRIPWKRLWRGAAFSTFLLAIGKVAFAWYLYFMMDKLNSIYGAAGSLVVFLIWVYYSAQILYFGAEVIRAEMTLASAQAAD